MLQFIDTNALPQSFCRHDDRRLGLVHSNVRFGDLEFGLIECSLILFTKAFVVQTLYRSFGKL